MSGYKYILLDKDPKEHIATLTLNRPDRRNALNDLMQDEIGDAIDEVEADRSMRVMVLTGSGSVFCAGGDLDQLQGGSQAGSRSDGQTVGWISDNTDEIRRSFQRFMLGLQRMEKPVIGMLNGAAVGAGFDLACICDIRIGTPRSRFMVAYFHVGLFPGFGGTWLYPRALGSIGKAAELLFTGDFLEAEEAFQMGFLNRLVPEEELESTTMAMARKIAAGPPIAIRLSKLMLCKGLEFDLETAMKMAAAAETITLTSADHAEGTAAFRESRPPIFEDK